MTADRTGHGALLVYCRALAAFSTVGSSDDTDGVLCVAGGSWIPGVGNGAFRTDDALAADDVIARADAFFGALGRGYSVKARDNGSDDDLTVACAAAGFEPLGDPAPQMVRRSAMAALATPDGIDLRAVQSAQGVLDFVAVNSEAYATYGLPTDVHASLFDPPDLVLGNGQTTIVVAYQGDRPVATALLFMDDGIGSVQWVGTLSDARHLGLGRLVTTWITNAAFEQGAQVCTLQASPMGAPIYRALGYETIFHYQDYVRWRVPQASGTGTPPPSAER